MQGATRSFQLQLLSYVEYQVRFTKDFQVHEIYKLAATSQKSKHHTFAHEKFKTGVWTNVVLFREQSEWLHGAKCDVEAGPC